MATAFELEVHRQCFGRLLAPNNRPITDCLFQDASSFNKSNVVTTVKSQWYDGRFVTARLFSGVRLMYSDCRSRLAAENAEKLLFIRTNMAAFNF